MLFQTMSLIKARFEFFEFIWKDSDQIQVTKFANAHIVTYEITLVRDTRDESREIWQTDHQHEEAKRTERKERR